MYTRSDINKFLRNFKSNGNLQDTAKRFAEFAHEGQLDKAGNEFFTHLERVNQFLKDYDCSETVLIVGWLHDIIDDGGFTLSDLMMFFPEEIWSVVKHLSHNRTSSREDYLEQIIQNQNAIVVKIADINDNMLITRKQYPNDREYQKTIKYNHEIEYLKSNMENPIF